MLEEAQAYTRDDLRKIGQKWLERIRAAEKREDTWRKDAEDAENAFTAGSEQSSDLRKAPHFNILHSNVETIVPSIYNSTPAPDVRPRHDSPDPVAKVVADIYERAIASQIDDGALDTEIEAEAQDVFMAGRGVLRLRFDATEGTDEMGQPTLTDERVVYEVVSWRDYREGPAKRWKEVPWVCFRHEISEEERQRIENPDLMALQEDYKNEEDLDCSVWEIWCKETRRVYFVIEDTGHVISIEEDPLGMRDFFPMPPPIQPITATGKRTPVCPYSVYKHLADELDTATKRINGLMKGLRARGVFAGNAEVAELVAELGDWELAPAGDMENLAALGGLDKAVMWWPIEQAITVLRELYAQREQTKQAIYEITGISDIIRGQGAASETATAQQIKTEWGSLRVKKMQRLIERQVRDIFCLTAEIIGKHFSVEGLYRASGMQEVAAPEVQQLLRDPLNYYRIDVESDSTVRADTTRRRQEMAEFLNGTAQFFTTMAGIAEQAPQSIGPMAEMYAAFARQFNLGKQAEDALDEFIEMAKQAGQGGQEDGAAAAAQAEMQVKMQEVQAKMQETQAKMQADAQKAQMDVQLKREQMQAETFRHQQEAEQKAAEAQARLQLDREKLAIERERLALDRAKLAQDADLKGQEIAVKREGKGEGNIRIGGVEPAEIQPLADALAESVAGIVGEVRAGNEAIAQMVQQGDTAILRALFAPRRLLRDEQGRPAGVEIVNAS